MVDPSLKREVGSRDSEIRCLSHSPFPKTGPSMVNIALPEVWGTPKEDDPRFLHNSDLGFTG